MPNLNVKHNFKNRAFCVSFFMLSLRPPLRDFVWRFGYNRFGFKLLIPMGEESVNIPDEVSRCSNDSFAVPGVSEFAPMHNPNQSPPSWNRVLTKEDYSYMHSKYFHHPQPP